MSVGIETLTVLVVLLPGFVCARLLQWLCPRPMQGELDKVIEALLYSFVVYGFFVLIFGNVSYDTRTRIGVLLAIPVAVALAVAALSTNDVLGSHLRKWGITHRTTRPSVWSDVFHHHPNANKPSYALVETGDSRLVLGWVRFYSDPPSEPMLFLEDACWVTADGAQHPIDGPGILITPACGIKTITFHYAIDRQNDLADLQ